ncbi:MAG: alpha/beta hydrolase [Alphaproteobacteria bacterium]
MNKTVLFVAPDSAERTFRRIAAALPEIRVRGFHTMLLGQAGVDLTTWSIDMEIKAIAEAASHLGAVDLVGYSGGAAMCLAFAAMRGFIGNMTLIEPPWIGNDTWSEEERTFVARFNDLAARKDSDFVTGFFEVFAPGFSPPNLAADALRMAQPLRAVWDGYRKTALDRANVALLPGSILLPFGESSAARMRVQAHFLATTMPRARVLQIPNAHHFDIMISGADRIAAEVEALASA